MALTEDIITHIDSALHDVQLLVEAAGPLYGQNFLQLRFKMRNLKRFVLVCAGEFCCLGSVLVRIEDIVRRNAQQLHPHCLQLKGKPTGMHKRMVSEFEKDIISLKEEIDEWYHSRQPPSFTTRGDGVLQIITSILGALMDVRSSVPFPSVAEMLKETIGAWEEPLSFMKTLIVLATKISVEPLHHFWALVEPFTVFASYHLFTFQQWQDFVSNLPVLQKDMKPVYEIYARILTRRSPWGMDDEGTFVAVKDFLDSLISDLWHLLRLNDCTGSNLKRLYAELRSLRAILMQQPDNLTMKMKQDIKDVVCDAGVFICSLHLTLEGELDLELQNLGDTINHILTEIGAEEPQVPTFSFPSQEDQQLKTCIAGNKQDIKDQSRMPSQGASTPRNEPVVGFRDEERLTVDRLTWGSKHLRIIAIVGMPGLGKTTFATRVYNNPSVLLHFSARAWTPVSQVVDRNKVLRDLFRQVDPIKCSETTEQDLPCRLRKGLKGRRYVIFLDDMWDIEAWTLLKDSFPDDNVGSRIILTSRQSNVAPADMLDQGPLTLPQLDQEESFELLQSKLSSRNDWPLPRDFGMEIAGKCRGLPLIIVIAAGVLKTLEPEDWDQVLDGLSNVSSIEQCINTLELSYKHLPDHLRPCFLYFGVFSEDQEVSVRKLIRLWVAEGFIHKNDTKSLEDIGELCLNELISRSLIMVAKQRPLGGVKTCRIHDLIRDFCLQKAKDEHFFHFLKGYDELAAFNEPPNLQRLCIGSDVEHFIQSKMFCPGARSLIFNTSQSVSSWCPNISSIIQISKLLRVLDLEQVEFDVGFQINVQQLVQLAFLAFRSFKYEVPEWIGSLLNLETLILQGESIGRLPDGLWSLQKLQYLNVRSNKSACCLPEQNLDSSSNLHELEKISGVVIPFSKMESHLRKFPNIRKLKCTLQRGEDDGKDLVLANILSRIESLSMSYYGLVPVMFDQFCLPANLKKLTLKWFSLSWRNITTISELPNLEFLKLVKIRLEGDTWEMKEGEFSGLKILKLVGLKLVRWCSVCDDDDQLKCLQKLVLQRCYDLDEVPCCLESISTLEIIEVSRCCQTVVDMLKQIEERRVELMGDSNLKIIKSTIIKRPQ